MAVAKERILSEIHRLAVENGGVPPGERAFTRLSRIKKGAWEGRFWIRWSQALEEAGYAANSWKQSVPEEDLLTRFAALARELGHFPLAAELKFKRHNDPDFPGAEGYRTRFGTLRGTADALLRYA